MSTKKIPLAGCAPDISGMSLRLDYPIVAVDSSKHRISHGDTGMCMYLQQVADSVAPSGAFLSDFSRYTRLGEYCFPGLKALPKPF